MNRITLASMFVVAVAAAPLMAQDPPVRPARPVQPAQPASPAPTPRPAIAPRPPMWDYDIDRVREQAREIERMSRDFDHLIPPMAMDVHRLTAEATRDVMANQREIAAAAREASRAVMDNQREYADMAREASRMAVDAAREFRNFDYSMSPMARPLPPMPAMAPMAPLGPMGLIGPRGAYWNSDDFVQAPAPWAQGDPADSLYRSARAALNGGEFGRAARMFQEITQKFPKSAYQADAPYWEATARYRIGTSDELHTAVKLLDPLVAKITAGGTTTTTVSNVPYAQRAAYGNQRAGDAEVMSLYLRINSALAQRGDREAADRVSKIATKTGAAACDNEDVQVKVEALNALTQMDAAQAAPYLRKVLDRKDECSIELRRRAVFMLGRRGDAESATLLVSTAKSDPSASVRSEAISWLPRLPGEVGINSLEEILRNEPDENIQRAVVRALTQSDNQKARSSMRGLIDRKDASVNLRVEAINSFTSDHATTDDAAYLRGLYGKADNDRVKEAVVRAVAKIGGPENDAWVLNLAKNANEPSQFRSVAISRLVQSNSISITDLGKLYDAADSYNVRQQIIGVLERRKEPEATDKLIDIVRNGTVYQLKLAAIAALGRKNDPRGAQLLSDLLEGKKP